MKIYGMVAASVFVLKLIFFGAGVCRAQDAGTAAASMSDPNAPKVILRVSADGDYEWKIGNDPYRRITAAMWIQQVLTATGIREITARRPNGKTSFDQMKTIAPGRQNLVHITMKKTPSEGPTTSETHPTIGGLIQPPAELIQLPVELTRPPVEFVLTPMQEIRICLCGLLRRSIHTM
jgi:hypothetical protein